MNQLAMSNHVAEIELIYTPIIQSQDKFQVICSKDAFHCFYNNWNKNTIQYFEEFKVMYLNQGNRVLGISKIGQGGITQTLADVRIILAIALKCASVSLLLCHNHPSGRLKPSEADIFLTKKLVKAATYMDIRIEDHLIISNDGYYSMSDAGLMPKPPMKL